MGKASFKILPENKLIIEKYLGTFFIHEYERMKKEEFAHPDFNVNYNVLADVRQASFGIKVNTPDKKMELVTEYLQTHKDKIGKRKCAFLAENPEQVVNSIFFSEYVKDLPIYVKTFSTVNAALQWLGVKNKENIFDVLD